MLIICVALECFYTTITTSIELMNNFVAMQKDILSEFLMYINTYAYNMEELTVI